MPETLRGTVERVTFHNPENGFAVLKVSVSGRSELVTVIGTINLVSAGEYLQATGHWVVDPQHGSQFKATELRLSHPASPAGIERYLGSGAIRGIGGSSTRSEPRRQRGSLPKGCQSTRSIPTSSLSGGTGRRILFLLRWASTLGTFPSLNEPMA